MNNECLVWGYQGAGMLTENIKGGARSLCVFCLFTLNTVITVFVFYGFFCVRAVETLSTD